jgi:methylmalonyl-CoA/ethylmalonyl-CoA epimerase
MAELSSIGQIAITVRRLARAVNFYRDRLGLSFLFEAGHMAFFECGGTRLMLSVAQRFPAIPKATFLV